MAVLALFNKGLQVHLTFPQMLLNPLKLRSSGGAGWVTLEAGEASHYQPEP